MPGIEQTPRTVAIYARISVDRYGDSEAPERQIEACELMCKAKGWTVKHILVDRDKSASNPKVDRPEFNQALKLARDGEVNTIIFWRLDRFTRRVAELAPLAEEFSDKVALVSVEGGIDTSHAMGRVFATIVAAIAQMESENIKIRTVEKNSSDARKGRYRRGGKRAYGRDLDGNIIEEEAEIIREVVDRYIEGETLEAISKDLNRRGVKTVKEMEWRGPELSRLIRYPHLRGIRTYKGKQFPGEFDRILDEETVARVTERLKGVSATPRVGEYHLLAGIAICGKCGARMGTAGFKRANGDRYPKYACRPLQTSKHCGGVAMSKHFADVEVGRKMVEHLTKIQESDDRESSDLILLMENLAQEIREEEARKDKLQDGFYLGDLDADKYHVYLAEVMNRIEAKEAEIKRLARQRAGTTIELDADPQAAWEKMTVPQQKVLIKRYVKTMTIKPMPKGSRAWEMERIEIEWVA